MLCSSLYIYKYISYHNCNTFQCARHYKYPIRSKRRGQKKKKYKITSKIFKLLYVSFKFIELSEQYIFKLKFQIGNRLSSSFSLSHKTSFVYLSIYIFFFCSFTYFNQRRWVRCSSWSVLLGLENTVSRSEIDINLNFVAQFPLKL